MSDFQIINGVLKKYTGADGDVLIPDGVTEIGKRVFDSCESLQSITLPDSITSIGEYAFSWCENLRDITIPESVTNIGKGAFDCCKKLRSMTIPESVRELGMGAFRECEDLQSITISGNIAEIGDDTFLFCGNLQNIAIPSSITRIGGSAFNGCKKLRSITIPDGVTSIGERAFEECETLESMILPDGITNIGRGAFRGCKSIRDITLPVGMAKVENGVFSTCESLRRIAIPDGITSIGADAFWGCEGLQSVAIPYGLETIGDDAFRLCKSMKEIRYSGKMPILQYFDLNDDLFCWIFRNSSNFHSDDIRYAWKDFERNGFRTEIASPELHFLEEQGFITKHNGFQLLDIFTERGNAECAAELLRYFSENQIFENDLNELHLELEQKQLQGRKNMEQKELLFALVQTMSVVGFEHYDEDTLTTLVAPHFDEHEYDAVGNHIFIRRCGKENAPRVLIDTHYDEIGLMVKDITEHGFLRICKMGGVDARILPAAEVVVYGKTKMPGIVLTKPRELMAKEEYRRLVPLEELLIDIGMTKEEAEETAPVGTPIGFDPKCAELTGGYVAGKGFDNKCSAASALIAIASLDMAKLSCDIYFSMSAREEVGQRAVAAATYRIRPDMAIVLDVTFGNAPGSERICSSDMKGGPVVSLTATLDTELTEMIVATAEKYKIPVQTVVEATRTSTHADDIYLAAGGVPTALVSIPVWFMHTANEVVHPDDMKNTSALLAAVINEKYGIPSEKEV